MFFTMVRSPRHAVRRAAPATSLDLRASSFDPKEKVWTKFPPEGSKHTPPHQSCEFKWKDDCPLVFRTLRKLFKVVHRNLLQEPIVTQWAGSGCSSNTCTNGGVIRWQ